ncbi:hypothetical protein HQQ94_02730 [Shewanella sp. VB17]|uniref:hypothetical protein n=1 Tax=Shewanella sp. VB17 TaxID=2739432 RepID=UPI001564BCEF|nr:hypothetical protein [Shewanella sp. VB17]NRD72169.1 hypothetical protein [Shewanella sp. VB17]
MDNFEAFSLEVLGSNNFPDLTITSSTFEPQVLLLECTGTLCDVFDQTFIEGTGLLRIHTQLDEVIKVEVKEENTWKGYTSQPLLTQIYRFMTDEALSLFIEAADQEGQMFKITVPLAQLAWCYLEDEN